jgi:hypothetical protein
MGTRKNTTIGSKKLTFVSFFVYASTPYYEMVKKEGKMIKKNLDI